MKKIDINFIQRKKSYNFILIAILILLNIFVFFHRKILLQDTHRLEKKIALQLNDINHTHKINEERIQLQHLDPKEQEVVDHLADHLTYDWENILNSITKNSSKDFKIIQINGDLDSGILLTGITNHPLRIQEYQKRMLISGIWSSVDIINEARHGDESSKFKFQIKLVKKNDPA